MKYLLRLALLLPLLISLSSRESGAQSTGNCEPALGQAYLDVNNVRARILNDGMLFYRGEPHVYNIPKGSTSNAIFASGIWLAGYVGGQLRAAATRYQDYEYWAGPLDDQGNPPADCAVFDKLYKVSRSDIEAYEVSGATTPDLRGWPTGLGAPTYAAPDNGIDDDEDGEIDEEGEKIKFDINVPLAQRVDRVVNLAAGERPAILGDQSIWWVMNDRGNTHESTETPPIGVEVHGLAFAFNTAGAIGNTTFYKYNIFYKGNVPLEDAYLGIFSDPDLGNASDDYVGSDTTLGLGYVYNADDEDEGGEGYGTPAPAAGYDFFQGPIVPSLGDTANVSGVRVPDFKNLSMTHFVFYNNGGGVTEDPQTGADYYNYMSGRWKDGKRITFGGNGRDFSEEPTDYMFTGDPFTGSGWSEFNPDPIGGTQAPIDPGDRRFAMSTGPFQINPGDQQEIVFGIVWSLGVNNLDSVRKLKEDDALAQAAYDVNFELPAPPAPPNVRVTESDGQVTLEWDNTPRSNNYLESYSKADPFAPDESKNYNFEGYDVIQFADVSDLVGKVIATYDVANGVTRVIDGAPGEPTSVTATGSDSGVQKFHTITNLTNYRTYFFGVQAFAYNEASYPKVYRGPITRVETTPARSRSNVSASAKALAGNTSEPDIVATKVAAGEGRVWADIVNPDAITGENYTIEFYEMEVADKRSSVSVEEMSEPDYIAPPAAKTESGTATTFDIKRGGTKLFDGSATGQPAPQRENLVVLDGLQFSVVGPDAGFKGFMATANAAGPIDPPDMAAFAFNSSGFPIIDETGLIPPGSYPDHDRPTRGVQQANSSSAWGIHTGGSGRTSWDTWLDRTILGRGRTIAEAVGANDYEWRFTQRCVDDPSSCIGWRRFEDDEVMQVPFELWNVGPTSDPGDDYRMLPAILDNGGEAWHLSTPGVDTVYTSLDLFDVGGDHSISGGNDDAYTDWVYWFDPVDTSPGEAGYQAFAADPGNGSAALGGEVMARTVLVSWNGWQDTDGDGTYDAIRAPMPEPGTIFKIVTLKPSLPGDIFTVATAGFEATAPSQAQKEARLEDIGVVPNPYKGASAYERSQLIDEVRFTNLPEQATIRVFTLNGTLIKVLSKNGPERTLSWDLQTDNRLPIASGLYLVHVEVPGVGDKVIKFAVVKKRTQLNTY